MSVEQIRELQRAWFGSQSSPTEFAVALNKAFDGLGFDEPFVNQCLLRREHHGQRTKVIKDNVWGMIELDEPAIRLLNCPILQRLRRIRQLGFSYLTYPTAEHSRFVHSLGMYGVITRFIQSAKKETPECDEGAGKYRSHQVPVTDVFDMQHAAMLHDTGHLPFSHATEAALQAQWNLTRIGGQSFEDFFAPAESIGVRSPKLAELLSVAIVLSPRFGRYYSEYVRPISESPNTKIDAALRVASLIMGRPVEASNVAYAELISGRVIDADKLDYVSRDGMACGIPTGIDVGRLFLRSSFLKFSKDELNRLRQRSGFQEVSSDQVHFIVNSSGRDTIEELISARTSLYHRVYFHQTTRNAERVYEKLIESALKAFGENPSELDALNIWSQSDEQMLASLTAMKDSSVRDLALRVSGRRLPKRAVVFGQSELMPLLPFRQAFLRGQIQFEDAPLRLQQLQYFSKRRLFGAELSELEAEVRDESILLRDLIHEDLEHLRILPIAGDQPLICISPTQFSPAVHDDCLVLQNHELVYSKELHNVTQTNDAEEIFQASGYVLTDEPWRELVFIAARKVLAKRTQEWTEIEARVGRSAAALARVTAQDTEYTLNGDAEVITASAFKVLNLDHDKVIGRAGLDRSNVARIEMAAGRHEYFDDFPYLVGKPDLQWEQLRSKFERFEGQYGWQISKIVAETFVWQFPPKFQNLAINLLREIEILDSQKSVDLVHSALRSFLAEREHRGMIRIAPLSPNSGHEVRIALEIAFRDNPNFSQRFSLHHSLEELFRADPRNESSIALIDDNVVSGAQAFAQLAAWVGMPRDDWPDNLRSETNIDDVALRADSRQRLLDAFSTRRLAFCVAVGSKARSESNRKRFVELIAQRSQTQQQQPVLFKDIGIDPPELFVGRDVEADAPPCLSDQKFVAFLHDAGRHCLAWAKYGLNYEDLGEEHRNHCDQNALGYGGVKGLLFTFRNVPVSTLTCLWAPGKFLGRPWMPLGLRRGYGKKVVLT